MKVPSTSPRGKQSANHVNKDGLEQDDGREEIGTKSPAHSKKRVQLSDNALVQALPGHCASDYFGIAPDQRQSWGGRGLHLTSRYLQIDFVRSRMKVLGTLLRGCPTRVGLGFILTQCRTFDADLRTFVAVRIVIAGIVP